MDTPMDTPTCTGPCLDHCYRCSPATGIVASGALMYTVACALYLVRTRDVGTPFFDSLSLEQRDVFDASRATRYQIFAESVAASVLAVAVLRPFY